MAIFLVLLWASIIGALTEARHPVAALTFMALTAVVLYWPGIHWS
jgi:hypothetical protein